MKISSKNPSLLFLLVYEMNGGLNEIELIKLIFFNPSYLLSVTQLAVFNNTVALIPAGSSRYTLNFSSKIF